jgi:hypothetical protein
VLPAVEPRWAIAGTGFALGLLFMAMELCFFSYDFEAETVLTLRPLKTVGS